MRNELISTRNVHHITALSRYDQLSQRTAQHGAGSCTARSMRFCQVWESFIHFECSIIIDWVGDWDDMSHECILWNQLYPTSFVPWFSELGLVTYLIRCSSSFLSQYKMNHACYLRTSCKLFGVSPAAAPPFRQPSILAPSGCLHRARFRTQTSCSL